MEEAKNLIMLIRIPEPSLVLLIGPSGSGKSTFARRHFRTTEILSSDSCRALVSDNEADQTATDDAFALLHLILAMRLKRRRTTVIDATNVQLTSRENLAAPARQRNIPLVALVFALPEEICQDRNRQRTDRQVPTEVIQQQLAASADSQDHLNTEGFHSIFTIHSAEEADSAVLQRIV
jgi:protein phosphatase